MRSDVTISWGNSRKQRKFPSQDTLSKIQRRSPRKIGLEGYGYTNMFSMFTYLFQYLRYLSIFILPLLILRLLLFLLLLFYTTWAGCYSQQSTTSLPSPQHYYIIEILRHKSLQPARRTYAFACVLILYKQKYMFDSFCAYFAIRHLLQPQNWSHLNSICVSPLF